MYLIFAFSFLFVIAGCSKGSQNGLPSQALVSPTPNPNPSQKNENPQSLPQGSQCLPPVVHLSHQTGGGDDECDTAITSQDFSNCGESCVPEVRVQASSIQINVVSEPVAKTEVLAPSFPAEVVAPLFPAPVTAANPVATVDHTGRTSENTEPVLPSVSPPKAIQTSPVVNQDRPSPPLVAAPVLVMDRFEYDSRVPDLRYRAKGNQIEVLRYSGQNLDPPRRLSITKNEEPKLYEGLRLLLLGRLQVKSTSNGPDLVWFGFRGGQQSRMFDQPVIVDPVHDQFFPNLKDWIVQKMPQTMPTGASVIPSVSVVDSVGTVVDPVGTVVDPVGTVVDSGGTVVDSGGTVVDPADSQVEALTPIAPRIDLSVIPLNLTLAPMTNADLSRIPSVSNTQPVEEMRDVQRDAFQQADARFSAQNLYFALGKSAIDPTIRNAPQGASPGKTSTMRQVVQTAIIFATVKDKIKSVTVIGQADRSGSGTPAQRVERNRKLSLSRSAEVAGRLTNPATLQGAKDAAGNLLQPIPPERVLIIGAGEPEKSTCLDASQREVLKCPADRRVSFYLRFVDELKEPARQAERTALIQKLNQEMILIWGTEVVTVPNPPVRSATQR